MRQNQLVFGVAKLGSSTIVLPEAGSFSYELLKHEAENPVRNETNAIASQHNKFTGVRDGSARIFKMHALNDRERLSRGLIHSFFFKALSAI